MPNFFSQITAINRVRAGTLVVNEYTPTSFSQSSTYSPLSATTSNMADGDYTTGAATNGGTQWIKADLGSAKSVGRVRVAGGTLPSGWGAVAAYLNNRKIQYSTDDSSWTDFVTITGASDSAPNFVDLTATPVSARYWRIESNGNSFVATTEFRLYSS